MSGIIPRSKAKGTDICSVDDYYYIIRSDLGCYMKTSDLHKGADISVFSLHPACQNGDHYLGGNGDYYFGGNAECEVKVLVRKGFFYIIKGDSYRRVTDLTTDSDAVVYSLHPDCQGGDHYFRVSRSFYIIFQEKATIRVTTDMSKDSDAEERPLHPNFRDGLYYWGQYYKVSDQIIFHFSFLKPASKWGVEFCNTKLRRVIIHNNLMNVFFGIEAFFGCRTDFPSTEEHTAVYSVHPNVLNFLPGGLSVTKGPASSRWENIKTITNESSTAVTWQKKITRKVGYNKETMSQITHNWRMAGSASIESGALAKLIANCQFSFSAEYGDSRVSTENQSWNEAKEEEEQLCFELKPNESLYLWQYRLGLGQESVLFCRDLKITNDRNPPTDIPLPSMKPP